MGQPEPLPAERLAELPGYDPDVAKNRSEARAIMEKLGYGANKRLAVTVSTRNTPGYRDPAVIAIDQMKEIYIDGTLEPIETANWFPKVIRKDYTIGVNVSETAVDDPDQMFYENYACGSDRNYTGFCDKEVDALIDRQSAEPNAEKRRQLVSEIERRSVMPRETLRLPNQDCDSMPPPSVTLRSRSLFWSMAAKALRTKAFGSLSVLSGSQW